MITDLRAALMDTELNLSMGARLLLLFVVEQGEGEHELAYATLQRFLQVRSAKTLRTIISEAEASGWLSVDRRGGNGRHPRFTCRVPNSGALPENRVEKNGTLQNDRVPNFDTLQPSSPPKFTTLQPEMGGGYMGGVNPSPSPSSKARAREDVENSGSVPQPEPEPARLADLRDWLGPDADAADALLPIAGSTTWAAAIIGKYGPNGTQEHAWGDIPEPRRPQIVAEALRDYAANGARPFRAKLFDGYVRSAREGPPRIAPGSEAASILANPRDPTPGAYRTTRSSGFATAGSALSSVVPPRVLERIRDSAREKLGAGADHAELEQEVQRLTSEWDRHHGRQVAVR